MPTEAEQERSDDLQAAAEILSIDDDVERLQVVAGLLELAGYSSQHGYKVVVVDGVTALEDKKVDDVRRCVGLSTFSCEALAQAVKGCA